LHGQNEKDAKKFERKGHRSMKVNKEPKKNPTMPEIRLVLVRHWAH
jgi:hypothetical protein